MQGFMRQSAETVKSLRRNFFFLGKYKKNPNARLSVEITASWLTRKSNNKSRKCFIYLKTRKVSLLIYGAIFHKTHKIHFFVSETKTISCECHENELLFFYFFEKCINWKSCAKKRSTQIENIHVRGNEIFEHDDCWMDFFLWKPPINHRARSLTYFTPLADTA